TNLQETVSGMGEGGASSALRQLQGLFHQVLEEAQVGPLSSYTPFLAYGFHPVSAGIPWLPGGCSVGIPANYNDTEQDGVGIVDRVLMVNGREVDWRSDAGSHLKETLTLSVEAKKFSLAREAFTAHSNSPIIQASVAPVWLWASASPAGLYNVVVAVLGLTGYFLCSDSVNQWLDYRADRMVAAVSKSYAVGGVEFYDKILARNRILRVLMGHKERP
ncbi:hypothetical protein GDO86_019081, partial [Hymenochirus boettgeri]